MMGVELRTKFAGKMYLSSNNGDKVAVDLKDALIQAGYPVHDDLLVFGNQIMFQVRTPITTTAEQGIAEMDKSQTPPGRDGGEQFPPGPKVSKKTIKAMQKDPAKALSDLFAKQYAKKKMKEEAELDEAVNEKQIKKDLDSGMSHDRVIGKHANKRLSNTDEIRKVIQRHAWDKRMKKQGVEEDVPVPTAMTAPDQPQQAAGTDAQQQAAMVAGAQAQKAQEVQAKRQEIQGQIRQYQKDITNLQRSMAGPL
jgi:hypothetical protein